MCTTPHQHNQNNPRRCGDVDIHDTNPQHFSCSHTTHNVQHNPPRVRTCCFFKHILQTRGVVPVIVSHGGGCVPVGVLCVFFSIYNTTHSVCAHCLWFFVQHTTQHTGRAHAVCHTFGKAEVPCRWLADKHSVWKAMIRLPEWLVCLARAYLRGFSHFWGKGPAMESEEWILQHILIHCATEENTKSNHEAAKWEVRKQK